MRPRGPVTQSAQPDPPTERAEIFPHILCAVDGSRSAAEAANQATILAGSEAALQFLAVTDARGVGATAQASLREGHAPEAVDLARRAARHEGVGSTGVVLAADDVGHAIVELAREHDLLVLGGYHRRRAAGMMLGGIATLAVHAAEGPVLVARHRTDVEFPGGILVASAGATDTSAVEIAARIAKRFETHLTLTHIGGADGRTRQTLARQLAAAMEITGTEPVVIQAPGDPANRIPQIVAEEQFGLLVTGSHRRHGIGALASVSERLAHRAPCSVLVLRTG